MDKHTGLGTSDFPARESRMKEQATHLGMEACKTREERADYVRRLVRGIFRDLTDVSVIERTKLVSGGSSGLSPIPEFEQLLDTWRDFPRTQLAEIIEQERALAAGEHLTLVEEEAA